MDGNDLAAHFIRDTRWNEPPGLSPADRRSFCVTNRCLRWTYLSRLLL